MFDNVLILAKGGHTAYFGPTQGAVSHFQSLGYTLTSYGMHCALCKVGPGVGCFVLSIRSEIHNSMCRITFYIRACFVYDNFK